MKKVDELNKQDKALKNKDNGSGKDTLYMMLLSTILSAIFTIIMVCLCYDGEFSFTGMPPFAVWLLLSIVLILIFRYSRLCFGTDNNSATVIGIVSVISLGASAIMMKYLSLDVVLLSLSSLIIVLVLSKREAVVSLLMTSCVFLVLIYVYNTYAIETPDYSIIITLGIKIITSLMLIVLYKPTFNRLNVVAIGSLSACLAFILSFIFNQFVLGTIFIESIMNAVWMFVAEFGATVLSLLLSPVLEWVFRLETSMQFLQYISFDQPLLKELADKAPGTFNHSVQVGYLAERCAYAIGENVNIAKAAAYFHDIGKMESPEFFTENQTDNYNPHDDLIFETSVKIITRHTQIGYEMLVDNKFPKIICDVAREHHGDSSLNYFYIKAQNITEGDVDSSDYCYPGPKPTTRISAIVMIADSVEAASRSMGLNNREGLVSMVDKLIKDKREAGQFDSCDITMRQLAIIRDTLVESLVGSAHTRITYPTRK